MRANERNAQDLAADWADDADGAATLRLVLVVQSLGEVLKPMLYWLGVYALVSVGVALPFIVLYVGVYAFWLGLAAIRSAIRTIGIAWPAWAAWADFTKLHWSWVPRKSAQV